MALQYIRIRTENLKFQEISITYSSCLRVTRIEVPRWVLVGQRATLRCHIDPEGETIYSMTWWKDGGQFYQYIPQNDPPAVVFTVPGIAINPTVSTLDSIQLVDVQRSSGGTYRCEVVADAPTFTTRGISANMTIVDAPDSKPVITGVAGGYKEGDIIDINCTSPRSIPPAELMWTIRGEKVLEEHLVRYEVVEELEETPSYTSTLGFFLKAQRTIFPRGFLTLRCTATVHDYQWHTDITLHFDTPTISQPHHLPTQLQTVKSCDSSLDSSLMLTFIIITIILLRVT